MGGTGSGGVGPEAVCQRLAASRYVGGTGTCVLNFGVLDWRGGGCAAEDWCGGRATSEKAILPMSAASCSCWAHSGARVTGEAILLSMEAAAAAAGSTAGEGARVEDGWRMPASSLEAWRGLTSAGPSRPSWHHPIRMIQRGGRAPMLPFPCTNVSLHARNSPTRMLTPPPPSPPLAFLWCAGHCQHPDQDGGQGRRPPAQRPEGNW